MRLLPLVALVTAVGPAAAEGPARESAKDRMSRFAAGSNAFGIDLYGRLKSTPGNLVVSPASVSTGLAMAWGGARGDTAARMRAVLHFDGSPGTVMQAANELTAALTGPGQAITFQIANRLFGERSYRFQPAFLGATRTGYGAPLEPLNFKGAPEQARARINGWVEERTRKRIRDLVPAGGVTSATRLALVNAIYFLGDWATPFANAATRPAPFRLSPTMRKDVPTMSQQEVIGFVGRDGLKAIELPYKGHGLSMLIVLPDAIDGVGALEAWLTAQRLDGIVKSLSRELVLVVLPKFEVDPAASLSLGDTLVSMGMGVAFDAQKADFTGIADPPNSSERLCIGAVFHKAFVKVDEKGTEAAAATAVTMMAGSALGGAPPPVPIEFKADHPFLFFIRDTATGLVLFMGRVSDPSAK